MSKFEKNEIGNWFKIWRCFANSLLLKLILMLWYQSDCAPLLAVAAAAAVQLPKSAAALPALNISSSSLPSRSKTIQCCIPRTTKPDDMHTQCCGNKDSIAQLLSNWLLYFVLCCHFQWNCAKVHMRLRTEEKWTFRLNNRSRKSPYARLRICKSIKIQGKSRVYK